MFIVSEIFPQHSGDLDTAEMLILQSKMAGANAVKLQLYEGNQFSTDGLDRSYIELNRKGLKRLIDFGKSINIPVFSTAFDEERLDWILDLDVKYLKVAARMHSEMPELVEKIVEVGITTFVSITEDNLMNDFKSLEHVIPLKCVSSYPTLLEDWDFTGLSGLGYRGISDHSSGISAALLANSKGLTYLEKHFTLSRNLKKH